jgi:hypothetical protein
MLEVGLVRRVGKARDLGGLPPPPLAVRALAAPGRRVVENTLDVRSEYDSLTSG